MDKQAFIRYTANLQSNNRHYTQTHNKIAFKMLFTCMLIITTPLLKPVQTIPSSFLERQEVKQILYLASTNIYEKFQKPNARIDLSHQFCQLQKLPHVSLLYLQCQAVVFLWGGWEGLKPPQTLSATPPGYDIFRGQTTRAT